jgi:hypothetical protein
MSPDGLHANEWISFRENLLELLKHFKAKRSIRGLKLVFDMFSFFDFVFLEEMAKSLYGVLNGIEIKKGWLRDPMEIISRLVLGPDMLKTLTLSQVQLHSSLSTLISSQSESLEHISIQSASCYMQPSALISAIGLCKRLKSLKLQIIDQSQVSELLSFNSISSELRVLDVSHCPRLDTSFFHLLADSSPHLQSLTATGTEINDDCIASLSAKCIHLKHLNLGRCLMLSSECLLYMKSLPHLSHLSIIYCLKILSSTHIVKYIMQLVEKCRQLRTLLIAPAVFPASHTASLEAKALMDANLSLKIDVNDPLKLVRNSSRKFERDYHRSRTALRFEGSLEVNLCVELFRALKLRLDGGTDLEKEVEGEEYIALKKAYSIQ